jgi:hypothetical protein
VGVRLALVELPNTAFIWWAARWPWVLSSGAWGPDSSGKWAFSLFCYAQDELCFVSMHFDLIFHVFHLYLPAQDKLPKLVESVSL